MEASMRPVFESHVRGGSRPLARHVGSHGPSAGLDARSGRKSLVIGSHADSVSGLPIPHGRSLLVRLQEWAAQPAFSYRHEWQEGDLVIWDNCGCMHRVVPYDENSGRRMHRTTIMGEERVA
jgi:alpha-ketoglutarate-dependent taurine dioxygenase